MQRNRYIVYIYCVTPPPPTLPLAGAGLLYVVETEPPVVGPLLPLSVTILIGVKVNSKINYVIISKRIPFVPPYIHPVCVLAWVG